MKKARIISVITTVCNCLFSFMVLISAAFTWAAINGISLFTQETIDRVKNIDEDSVVAGYALLIAAFGSIGGLIGTFVAIILFVFELIVAGYFLIPSIVGLCVDIRDGIAVKRAIPTKVKSFKADAMVKMIFNGIAGIFCIWEAITEHQFFKNMLWLPLISFAAVTALAFFQYKSCKEYETSMENEN